METRRLFDARAAEYRVLPRTHAEWRQQYASVDGVRREAFPGTSGLCPQCDGEMIPRCGGINHWHWAHKSRVDCDPWHEHESEWHRRWKSLVRAEYCEVKIGEHRADIVGNEGVVIELQHSSISPQEIAEREVFYGLMIWVFDAEPFAHHVDFRVRKGFRDEFTTFRWKHARKTHGECTRPVFWNFPAGYPKRLFEVRKVHVNSPVGGWGYWVDRQRFINRYLSQVLRSRAPDIPAIVEK